MQVNIKQQGISTIAELKEFLEGIPGEIPVKGLTDRSTVTAVLWVDQKQQDGPPSPYVTFDTL